MQALRRMLAAAGAVVGPAFLAAQRRRGAGVVALYHRVSPDPDPSYPPVRPDVFARHLDYLARSFALLPIREFLDRRRAGRALSGCCALTFDDGYRDFRDHAAPALRKRGIVVGHYLVTDCLNTGRATWNLRLNRVLRWSHPSSTLRDGNKEAGPGAAASGRIPSGGAASATTDGWVLPNGDCVSPADLKDRLGSLSPEAREAWLLQAEAGLSGAPPEPPLLTLDEVRQWDPGTVEWGSHTTSHANLGSCPPALIERELRGSRELLEQALGREIRVISYPNGSYSPDVLRIAAEAGYTEGFAVDQQEVGAGAALLAIPRFDIGLMPETMLALELSGALSALRGARGRLRGGRSG